MMANSFIFNGMNGAISSLSDIFTREVLGPDVLVSAFSWMDLVAAALQFMLGFYPGKINHNSS